MKTLVALATAAGTLALAIAAVSAGHARPCGDPDFCGTNGTVLNGITLQGSALQGNRTHGTPGETIIISSAGLVRLELPR